VRRAAVRLVGALAAVGAACAGPQAAPPARDSAAERAPPSRAVPLAGRDRAAWRAVLGWSAECEQGFALVADRGSGVELFALPDGTLLAQVACAPGAYQGSYVYFRVDSAGASAGRAPLTFPDYVDSGAEGRDRLQPEQTAEIVGLPTVVPAEGRLRVLRRFRGLGDCGLLLTYDVAAPTPALVGLRGKLACDGDASVPPERWGELERRR
jgi:hypothetical protein